MPFDPQYINALCGNIQTFWKHDIEGLMQRIEAAYHHSDIPLTVDRNDQQYFLAAVYEIVRKAPLTKILQTGTFIGSSTVAIALALEDNGNGGLLETIDPEPRIYGGHDEAENPVDIARKVIKDNDFSKYVKFSRGYSVKGWDHTRIDMSDAPEGLLFQISQQKEFDMLIVDGDHTYNGTFWDMEIGFRALRPDGPGLIFVHDYSGIPSVRSAVKDWRKLYQNKLIFRAYNKGCGFSIIQCHPELLRKKEVAI